MRRSKKSNRSFLLLSVLICLSFFQADRNIKGFWLYCETPECKNVEDDEPCAGLIFEDSVCHVFIGMKGGLEPQIMRSSKYKIINDSLYSYQQSEWYKYALSFLNDSTIQLSVDSTEPAVYRRVK